MSQIWISYSPSWTNVWDTDTPAARAQGQAGQMIFLREVGRQANDVALERRLRAADRQAADFLRGRDVAVQERRRQVADRDVVEAVTAVIGWQERGGVDVESQQISDGVLIFGPIQAAERVGAAGIRFGGGRRIERCFQPCQQRAPVVLGRLRHVGRRHGARVHLAHHLFPDFGFSTGVGDVDPVQPQVRRLEPFVVARDAVPIEQTTGARRGRYRTGGRAGRGLATCCRPACCADVCTCRQTHRVTATPTDPSVTTLAKGNSFVM